MLTIVKWLGLEEALFNIKIEDLIRFDDDRTLIEISVVWGCLVYSGWWKLCVKRVRERFLNVRPDSGYLLK